MGERSGPDKDQLIDALVLVFAHSDLAKLVGTDALRSVIGVEYHDMVRDGVFDMQQLWELLSEQPGFTAEAAGPPLCLLKNWEARLGVEFRLPEQLAALPLRERNLQAAQCRVPSPESKRVLRVTAPPLMTERARRNSTGGRQGRTTVPPTPAAGKPDRPAWQGWVAGAIALASIVFISVVLYGHFRNVSGAWQQAGVKLDNIPAHAVTRLGNQVRAEIDASAWSKLDADTKRTTLRQALLGVEDQGVKVIALREGSKVVATVQKARAGKVFVWLGDAQ